MTVTAIPSLLALRRVLVPSVRHASTGAKVTVKMDGNGVATLTLNNPPVNVLDAETLDAYAKEMRALDENKDCRGVIIASACKAFSAGLDIKEFCTGDRDRLRGYWRAMQELWYQTYKTRLATVAAVNGAAIAGGCVLAVCCDVRVMANTGPKSVIGLNETKLGITTPFWINDRMIQLVGHQKMEQAILRGTLYDAKEALAFGYVDRVVGSDKELMDVARQEMKQLLEIPDQAREGTKRVVRQPLVDKFHALREQNIDDLTDQARDQRTQAVVQTYLASLTKKKA